MLILQSPVVEKKKIQENVFILKIHSPEIASIINPGQFLNIRVSEKSYPLLRRPFSVCDIESENIVLMFNILGEGTRIMASKSSGDNIDILGPLGRGFNLDGEYETAVIVAGGLGAAPFPFITRKLLNKKKIHILSGNKHYTTQVHLKNTMI